MPQGFLFYYNYAAFAISCARSFEAAHQLYNGARYAIRVEFWSVPALPYIEPNVSAVSGYH